MASRSDLAKARADAAAARARASTAKAEAEARAAEARAKAEAEKAKAEADREARAAEARQKEREAEIAAERERARIEAQRREAERAEQERRETAQREAKERREREEREAADRKVAMAKTAAAITTGLVGGVAIANAVNKRFVAGTKKDVAQFNALAKDAKALLAVPKATKARPNPQPKKLLGTAAGARAVAIINEASVLGNRNPAFAPAPTVGNAPANVAAKKGGELFAKQKGGKAKLALAAGLIAEGVISRFVVPAFSDDAMVRAGASVQGEVAISAGLSIITMAKIQAANPALRPESRAIVAIEELRNRFAQEVERQSRIDAKAAAKAAAKGPVPPPLPPQAAVKAPPPPVPPAPPAAKAPVKPGRGWGVLGLAIAAVAIAQTMRSDGAMAAVAATAKALDPTAGAAGRLMAAGGEPNLRDMAKAQAETRTTVDSPMAELGRQAAAAHLAPSQAELGQRVLAAGGGGLENFYKGAPPKEVVERGAFQAMAADFAREANGRKAIPSPSIGATVGPAPAVEPSTSSGGLRGWANPAVQEAAQRARREKGI